MSDEFKNNDVESKDVKIASSRAEYERSVDEFLFIKKILNDPIDRLLDIYKNRLTELARKYNLFMNELTRFEVLDVIKNLYLEIYPYPQYKDCGKIMEERLTELFKLMEKHLLELLPEAQYFIRVYYLAWGSIGYAMKLLGKNNIMIPIDENDLIQESFLKLWAPNARDEYKNKDEKDLIRIVITTIYNTFIDWIRRGKTYELGDIVVADSSHTPEGEASQREQYEELHEAIKEIWEITKSLKSADLRDAIIQSFVLHPEKNASEIAEMMGTNTNNLYGNIHEACIKILSELHSRRGYDFEEFSSKSQSVYIKGLKELFKGNSSTFRQHFDEEPEDFKNHFGE